MSNKKRVAVIGAGSWGTAIAVLLANKGLEASIWVRKPAQKENMIHQRENAKYLPGVPLPDKLSITSDLEQAVSGSDVLVFSVPSHATRETARQAKPFVGQDTLAVGASKGIEVDSLKTMSQVLSEELFECNRRRVAVLSGPNHAEEVSKQVPSATVIASRSRKTAEELQKIFITSMFRVYTNPDVTGVELGGALKNIIALGTGISDGLGFGDNTKAAFMTRGLYEISRLGINLGARPITFAGLSGVGDLIVTCTSDHSRNRRAGKMIGQGQKLEEIIAGTEMVIEGVTTTKAAIKLAEQAGTEMPITKIIYDILFNHKEPMEGVTDLMERVRTNEMEEVVEEELWED